jgi:hypothetical protein
MSDARQQVMTDCLAQQARHGPATVEKLDLIFGAATKQERDAAQPKAGTAEYVSFQQCITQQVKTVLKKEQREYRGKLGSLAKAAFGAPLGLLLLYFTMRWIVRGFREAKPKSIS